jgi:HK97 family phage portal protein
MPNKTTEIQKKSTLTNWLPSFILRAFGQVESNPKAPEHGASWAVGNGVSPTFSPRQSMAVFGKHAYTHACVTRASQDIASLPIKLLSGKGEQQTEIDESPLLDLFDQPSTNMDGYLFKEQLIVDLMMTGNCYILIVGDLSRPTSLYRLHPENVRIIPDPVKMIQGYEYNDGGSTAVYPVDRVIHTRSASWDINSNGELYGSGLVEALNEEITADINAQRMASSVSKQGRPDVLLSPADPADIWDRRRRQEITQAYKAMTESGGAMALSGQIKVETLNLSPRDLEFQALRTMVRENISAVCGVPSTVLGLPDANYATARQATITYWEIQQKRAKKIEQAMTRIARLVDPSYSVQIDFSGIDALQAIRTEKLERIVRHIENGMTASEAYAYEGLTDSPFGETETESQIEADQAIEQALTALLTKEMQKKNTDALEMRGSVGDVDPTNFPEDGEDQQVALRNSNFDRFPHDEAQDLKDNYPEIWNKGGNILGNKQYNRLKPIAERDSSIAQTETEEKAIRLREAWAARHFRDYRLAGVVAQIKWLVVGSRGLSHMRAVISAEKNRLESKQARTTEQKDRLWHSWIERTYEPAQRQIMRASQIYLEDAAQRYARRAQTLRTQLIEQESKAIDYASILGRATEIKAIRSIIGRAYRSIYFLTGNDQIEELYKLIGATRPLDFSFGERQIDERQIAKLARQIVDTNEKQVKRLVRRGITDGLPNAEIARQIASATTFSESRAQRIAQTETTKAINTATNEAYKEFQDAEGVQVMKEWISSRDDSVRQTHADLDDGDPIPVDSDFEIDGYAGPAPASFGDPAMDINCRCTIAPVIVESTK